MQVQRVQSYNRPQQNFGMLMFSENSAKNIVQTIEKHVSNGELDLARKKVNQLAWAWNHTLNCEFVNLHTIGNGFIPKVTTPHKTYVGQFRFDEPVSKTVIAYAGDEKFQFEMEYYSYAKNIYNMSLGKSNLERAAIFSKLLNRYYEQRKTPADEKFLEGLVELVQQ